MTRFRLGGNDPGLPPSGPPHTPGATQGPGGGWFKGPLMPSLWASVAAPRYICPNTVANTDADAGAGAWYTSYGGQPQQRMLDAEEGIKQPPRLRVHGTLGARHGLAPYLPPRLRSTVYSPSALAELRSLRSSVLELESLPQPRSPPLATLYLTSSHRRQEPQINHRPAGASTNTSIPLCSAQSPWVWLCSTW